MAGAFSPPLLRGNRQPGESRPHLAVAAAKPEGAREGPQLRFVLYLGSAHRAYAPEAGCTHRHVSAITMRACGMVDCILEARPVCFRSARSLAGIARRRRCWERKYFAPSDARLHRGLSLSSCQPHRSRVARVSRPSGPALESAAGENFGCREWSGDRSLPLRSGSDGIAKAIKS